MIIEWQKRKTIRFKEKITTLVNHCVRIIRRFRQLNIPITTWSAFEGKTNAADSLSGLMLRKLESGEQVGEIVDEFKEGIERINNSFLVTM